MLTFLLSMVLLFPVIRGLAFARTLLRVRERGLPLSLRRRLLKRLIARLLTRMVRIEGVGTVLPLVVTVPTDTNSGWCQFWFAFFKRLDDSLALILEVL